MSLIAECNPAVTALRAVALPESARAVEVVCTIDDDHEFDLVALGACLIGGVVLDEPTFRWARWEQHGVSYMAMNVPSFTAPA